MMFIHFWFCFVVFFPFFVFFCHDYLLFCNQLWDEGTLLPAQDSVGAEKIMHVEVLLTLYSDPA